MGTENEIKKEEKKKKWLLSIFFLALVILVCYAYIYNRVIDSSKAYVICRVTNVSSGGGDFPTFDFYYRYGGHRYDGSFSGNFNMTDSMLVIKISRKYPSMYTYTYEQVQECYAKLKFLDSFWLEIPSCPLTRPSL